MTVKSSAFAIALAMLLAASAAGAQEDASSHFDRGLTFFKDGDYTAAMVEFKKAYELDPNYRGLYNLGQTSKEMRDYAAALDSFERYLAEGGSEIEPERRKKVEGWVAELREKIARVTLATSVPGAEITVDDVLVGKTPLAKPVTMNAGRRRLVVTKDGYAPLTRFVDVAGTETKTIELELTSLSGGGGGGSGPPVVEIEHTAWPWVGLGVTGALGIATGVVGGLALGKKASFDDALNTLHPTGEVIEEARTDARRFAIAADVLGGVTGAMAVLTVIAFAVDYGRSAPSATAGGAETKETARVILAPGFVGVQGSF